MRVLIFLALTPSLTSGGMKGFVEKVFNSKFGHLKNIHTIKAEAESRGKAMLRDRDGYWSKWEYTPLEFIDPDLTLKPKYRGKTVDSGPDIYKTYSGYKIRSIKVNTSTHFNQYQQTPLDPWYGTPDMSNTEMPQYLKCSHKMDRMTYNVCVRNQHNTFFVPVMQRRGGSSMFRQRRPEEDWKR